jgi:hypothetical protein
MKGIRRASPYKNLQHSRARDVRRELARAGDFSNGVFFYHGSLRSHRRAGVCLGTTIMYPQCTMTQRPENCATHNERCRGQRTGHLDQVSVTHNERCRGQRHKPMPGITHVPLRRRRPAFALFRACLIRQQAEYHCRGLGFRCQVFLRRARALSSCSYKKILTNIYNIFSSAARNNTPILKKQTSNT